MALDTPTIRRTITSLLNAAGYTNLALGSISSGGTTLTVSDATFVSTDVSKYIAVLGAGAGLSVLVGSITNYASPTQVVINSSASISVTNAPVSYGGRIDDDRRNLIEIEEAMFGADLEVCRAILETPNHPRWGSFTLAATSGVASGTQIVGHGGTIQQITRVRTSGTVPATLVPYRTLVQWVRNDGAQFASAAKENFVAIEGGAIYFAGGGTASYKTVNLTKGTTLQAPDDYAATVVRGALGTLLAKEGDNLSGASYYQQAFYSDLAAIRTGNLGVPPIARQEARG